MSAVKKSELFVTRATIAAYVCPYSKPKSISESIQRATRNLNKQFLMLLTVHSKFRLFSILFNLLTTNWIFVFWLSTKCSAFIFPFIAQRFVVVDYFKFEVTTKRLVLFH